jgi:TIR domain/SIR2-like domain
MNNTFSTDDDWDELFGLITKKQLTPILGKEIYKFRDGGKLILLDDFLSQQILASYNIKDQPSLTLIQAINYLVNEQKVRSGTLCNKLLALTANIKNDFPLLTDLLSIKGQNYFLNTEIYYNVLENILHNITNETVQSINWSDKGFTDCGSLEGLNSPLIFNIFGSLNSVALALSEEQLLEFTGNYYEKIRSTPNIQLALNKNLLFIGCSFPEWMVRFILRLLSNQPLHEWGSDSSNRQIIIINDDNEFRARQNAFLKNLDVVTYPGTTEDFVTELSKRWNEKNPNKIRRKKIFLSYTGTDRPAVETFKKAIEESCDLACWYDQREIAPGNLFDTLIAQNLRDSILFIPLISENSLAHKDGYVQKEWDMADTLNTYRKIDNVPGDFIIPVVIDNTSLTDVRIKTFFPLLSLGVAPQGNPGNEFINNLKKTLNLTS